MHFKLNIPEPCHEDWSIMTPASQGRFCASCKKEVVDFTELSRKQIADKVKNGEKICGRYRKDQLETTYFIPEHKPLRNLGIAAAFTSLLALCEPVQAQKIKASSQQEQQSKENQQVIEINSDKSFTFNGTVLDQNDYPLPGAAIQLENTNITTQTDFDGNFNLKIPVEVFNKSDKLICSYIGFETKNLILNTKQSKVSIALKQDPSEMTLGMVVVGYVVQKKRTNKPRSKYQ